MGVWTYCSTFTTPQKNSYLIIVEKSKKLVKKYNIREQIKEFRNHRIILYIRDVFQAIMTQQYVSKTKSTINTMKDIILFDFDFTSTAYNLTQEYGLYKKLRTLAKSNIPNQDGFWILLTFCRRNDITQAWNDVSSEMKKIFINAGWNYSTSREITYHDGAPMINILHRYTKLNSKQDIEKREERRIKYEEEIKKKNIICL